MKARYDKILFAAAALALVAACVWFLQPQPMPGEKFGSKQSGMEPLLPASPSEELALRPSPWLPPDSHQEQAAWIFDLFTPPPVYFHPEDETFSLEPPRQEEVNEPENDGLRLAGFGRVRYRLQYCGYAGGEGSYLINLRDEESESWLVGKVGQEFPQQDFSIRNFQGPAAAGESAALTIYDQRLDKEIVLCEEPSYEMGRLARFALNHQTGTEIEAAENESFQAGPATYLVKTIDCAGGKAVLSRTVPGKEEPETVILYLPNQAP